MLEPCDIELTEQSLGLAFARKSKARLRVLTCVHVQATQYRADTASDNTHHQCTAPPTASARQSVTAVQTSFVSISLRRIWSHSAGSTREWKVIISTMRSNA